MSNKEDNRIDWFVGQIFKSKFFKISTVLSLIIWGSVGYIIIEKPELIGEVLNKIKGERVSYYGTKIEGLNKVILLGDIDNTAKTYLDKLKKGANKEELHKKMCMARLLNSPFVGTIKDEFVYDALRNDYLYVCTFKDDNVEFLKGERREHILNKEYKVQLIRISNTDKMIDEKNIIRYGNNIDEILMPLWKHKINKTISRTDYELDEFFEKIVTLKESDKYISNTSTVWKDKDFRELNKIHYKLNRLLTLYGERYTLGESVKSNFDNYPDNLMDILKFLAIGVESNITGSDLSYFQRRN